MSFDLRAMLRRAAFLSGVLQATVVALSGLAAQPVSASAIVTAAYAGSYSATSIAGPVAPSNDPLSLTFAAGDSNTVLFGEPAAVANATGTIYAVPVTRGGGGHITAFGTPAYFASASVRGSATALMTASRTGRVARCFTPTSRTTRASVSVRSVPARQRPPSSSTSNHSA